MIKWAFESLEAFSLFTLLSLVNQWMKLLLFPSMTVSTLFKSLTSFLITCNKGATLPILAQFSLIFEKIWFSSKVLEVVRVHTLGFVVLMIVRTPFGFEKEDVKVKIRMVGQQVMDQTHFDIFYGMCERTILSVLASSNFVWIKVAEFSFIFIFMI
jgi:hypothetical protein